MRPHIVKAPIALWDYINLPFKPEGQPDGPVNILTALAENESY
jgi:hypothetical protein